MTVSADKTLVFCSFGISFGSIRPGTKLFYRARARLMRMRSRDTLRVTEFEKFNEYSACSFCIFRCYTVCRARAGEARLKLLSLTNQAVRARPTIENESISIRIERIERIRYSARYRYAYRIQIGHVERTYLFPRGRKCPDDTESVSSTGETCREKRKRVRGSDASSTEPGRGDLLKKRHGNTFVKT